MIHIGCSFVSNLFYPGIPLSTACVTLFNCRKEDRAAFFLRVQAASCPSRPSDYSIYNCIAIPTEDDGERLLAVVGSDFVSHMHHFNVAEQYRVRITKARLWAILHLTLLGQY